MTPKNTHKTVKSFAWASFLNDFGSEMIYPIWPVFVTTVLGAPMSALGFIDGLGDAIVSISQVFSGYLSDKMKKRKVFIWLGYVFGSLSRIGYALSSTWPQLIPFRILDRAGKMRGAPRDAMIADISTHENRGRNFGILRSMDNLGAVFGIVFSILMIKLLGYKTLFLIAALPSALAALLIFFFIKEEKEVEKKIFKGLKLGDLDRNFRFFLFLSTLFALGSFSYSFLLIFAKNLNFSIVSLPILYLIFTGTASVSSLPFGMLSDKIGRKKVLILSFLLWALVCITLIASPTHLSVLFAFILYGLHKGGMDTVQKAFVSELCPSEYRASALGGFQMLIGLAALPASFLAGLAWDMINPLAPFCFSLGLTVVSIVLLMFVSESTKQRNN